MPSIFFIWGVVYVALKKENLIIFGSLINWFFVCSKSSIVFLMVDTGSSYNRVMSSLKILYCVEGVPLWQQIMSLFEIFLSWFPLTWFSMRPLGQVPLLYYLPLLHWRTWAKKGPSDAGWSHGVQGHLESIWWWLDELLIDVMAYNKGIVCLFFFPHFLVS